MLRGRTFICLTFFLLLMLHHYEENKVRVYMKFFIHFFSNFDLSSGFLKKELKVELPQFTNKKRSKKFHWINE